MLSGDLTLTTLIQKKALEPRPFGLVYADLPYGTEGDVSAKDFTKMCENITLATTAAVCTIFVHPGDDMFSGFKGIMKKVFGNATPVHYFKPNARIGGLNRHCGMMELGIMSHWTRTGVPAEPFQIYNWPATAASELFTGKARNPNMLIFEKPTVLKKCETKPISKFQKPLAMMEYIHRVYGRNTEWTLEICAGSGTFSVAALQAGKNAVCVEKDKWICKALQNRLYGAFHETHLDEVPREDEEDEEDEGTQALRLSLDDNEFERLGVGEGLRDSNPPSPVQAEGEGEGAGAGAGEADQDRAGSQPEAPVTQAEREEEVQDVTQAAGAQAMEMGSPDSQELVPQEEERNVQRRSRRLSTGGGVKRALALPEVQVGSRPTLNEYLDSHPWLRQVAQGQPAETLGGARQQEATEGRGEGGDGGGSNKRRKKKDGAK